jgi:translocation and assembly module TamB
MSARLRQGAFQLAYWLARPLLYLVATLFVALLTFLGLLSREAGRLWLLQQVQMGLTQLPTPVALILEQPRWPAWHRFEADGLLLIHNNARVAEATDLALQIAPASWRLRAAEIESLSLGTLTVYASQPASASSNREFRLGIPQLPPLHIRELALGELHWIDREGRRYHPSLPAGPWRLDGRLTLNAAQRFALDLNAWSPASKDAWLQLRTESYSANALSLDVTLRLPIPPTTAAKSKAQPAGDASGGPAVTPTPAPPDALTPDAHIVALDARIVASQSEAGLLLALDQLTTRVNGIPLRAQGQALWQSHLKSLSAVRVDLETGDSRHQLTGRFDRAAWQLTTHIQDLDLGLFRPWIPRLVSGRLNMTGHWQGPREAALGKPEGEGMITSQFVLDADPPTVGTSRCDNAAAPNRCGDSHTERRRTEGASLYPFALSGRLAFRDSALHLDEVVLRQDKAQLAVSGALHNPDNSQQLRDWHYALDYRLTGLTSEALNAFLPHTAREAVAPFRYRINRLVGELEGPLRAPRWQITELTGKGDWNLNSTFPHLKTPASVAPEPFEIAAVLAVDNTQIHFHDLELASQTTNIALKGGINWQDANWSLKAQIQKGDLLRLKPYWTDYPMGLEGVVDAHLTLSGSFRAPSLEVAADSRGKWGSNRAQQPFSASWTGGITAMNSSGWQWRAAPLNITLDNKPLLNLQGILSPTQNALTLQLTQFPTQLLRDWEQAVGLGGLLEGGLAEARLELTGTLNEPNLNGAIAFSKPSSPTDPSERLHWNTDIRSRDGALLASSILVQHFVKPIPSQQTLGKLELRLPWQLYRDAKRQLTGPQIEPLPLTGFIKGEVDMGALSVLFDHEQGDWGGKWVADLQLEGQLQHPELSGEILLENGFLHYPETGTQLNDIQVYIQAAGQELKLLTAFARDGEGGTLTGSGKWAWAALGQESLAMQFRLDKAALIDMRNLKASLSGDLRLQGDRRDLLLQGALALQPLSINIDTAPSSSLPTLKVIDIYPDHQRPSSAGGVPLQLDLLLSADKQAFIRGRGLSAEIAGDLKITGRLSDPTVAGFFKTRQGELALFQKPLKLQEGEVRLSYRHEAARFHYSLPATYDAGDTDIRVLMSGGHDSLTLELSSVPALPQEEILSRLLFGTNVQNITALQAITLANAINTLSNGSRFDPIGSARDKLGIDSLRLEQGDKDAGGGIDVGVGKYLNERVYLEVERSNNPAEPWQGNVQIDLTDEFRLKSTTGTQGKTRAELQWRRDY